MKKVLAQIREYWLINLITFLISLTIGVIIFCLFFFLRNMTLIAAVDGLAVGTVFVLLSGLLAWVAHLGFFDFVSFGFKQLGSAIFAKDPKRDGDFADYKERKTTKRATSSHNFVAIIAAGLLLSIALIIVEIIYRAQF